MKTIKLALTAASLIFLAGCATTFRPWSLSEIEDGMGKEDVVKILGEPDYTETKNGVEYLYYTYEEEPRTGAEFDFNTEVGRENRARDLKQSFKVYTYQVKLDDGKVIGYEEVQNQNEADAEEPSE